MPYVIACGDEGVQLNQGTRIGVVGAGFKLDGFSEVVKILNELFAGDLVIAANEENSWVKSKLDLSNWEQVNASSQQHIEALADKVGLKYAGFLPFADPRELEHGVKGHMVRPPGIHFARKVCFTLDGGEQVFNLGQFVISAEWLHQAPLDLAKSFITAQLDFYQKLVGDTNLTFTTQQGGELGEQIAAQNRAVLEKLGYVLA